MPIYLPGDAVFHDFDPAGRFFSSLPPAEMIKGAQFSDFYEHLLKTQSVRMQTQNYTELARGICGRVAITHGMEGRLQTDLDVFYQAGLDVLLGKGVNWKQVAQATIGGTLAVMDVALQDIATKVPFVRIAVRIGLLIYEIQKQVKAYLQGRQEEQEPWPESAMVYDEVFDAYFVNQFLFDALVAKDWTPFFVPPLTGPISFEWGPIAWTDRGIAEGTKVEISGDVTGGFGFVPGSARMCGDVFQIVTYPTSVSGYSGWQFAPYEAFTEEATSMLPSAAQFGATAWQMVMKNSPNMFRINPSTILGSWQSYFGALYNWGYGYQRLHPQVSTAIYMLSIWASAGQHGDYRSLVPGYDWDDIPATYREKPTTYDHLVRYVLEQQWEGRWEGKSHRLLAALRTLTCAYVDETFPTIRWAATNAIEVWRYHDEMRRELLHGTSEDAYRGRQLVDLELIPPGAYRNAMTQAKTRGPPGMKMPTEPRPPKEGLDATVAIVATEKDKATIATLKKRDEKIVVGIPEFPAEGGGGAIVGALALLGLGAGGAYVLTKRRRRR